MPANPLFFEEKKFAVAIRKWKKEGYTIIGVTGHRDLMADDRSTQKDKIAQKLEKIRRSTKDGSSGKAVLISPMAPGADQLVYEAFKEVFPQNGKLCFLKVLPEKKLFAETFKGYTIYEPTKTEKEESGEDLKVIDTVYSSSSETAYMYYERKASNEKSGDGDGKDNEKGGNTEAEQNAGKDENHDNDPFKTYITTEETDTVSIFHFYKNEDEKVVKKPEQYFILLGEILVGYCTHIIALWDGLYGSGKGGTGNVAECWTSGINSNGKPIKRSKKEACFHHLPIRRTTNHFPIARKFDPKDATTVSFQQKMQWVKSVFHPKTKTWHQHLISFLSSYKIWLFLLGIVVVHHFLFIRQRMNYDFLSSLGFLMILVSLIGWFHVRYNSARILLQRFIYPLLLGIFTLGLGTYGFYTVYGDVGNSFYRAANLFTLTTSDFSTIVPCKVSHTLLTARNLGAFTIIYTFLLAFALASGRENIDRLAFWWFRLRSTIQSKKNFTVIIGNGERPLHLALNMEEEIHANNKRTRIVLLSETISERAIKDKKIWLIKGKIALSENLRKTYAYRAKEVFVLSDSNEENFEVAQELHAMYAGKDKKITSKWYVHQHEVRQREILQKLALKNDTLFSLNENIIRNLFLKYPVDRFRPNNSYDTSGSCSVILLGFNAMAQAIAVQAVRQGHYDSDKSLQVTVYYTQDEEQTVHNFCQKYPELCKNMALLENLTKSSQERKSAQHYVFGRLKDNLPIVFEKLPQSETDICDRNWSFYTHIVPHKVVSIYVCLASSLENIALLGSILPRVKHQKIYFDKGKQCDVQVFCQYQADSAAEVRFMEMQTNQITGNIPIQFFGNHQEVCSLKVVENKEQDGLAKRIALLYDLIYGANEEDCKVYLKTSVNEFSVLPEITRAIRWMASGYLNNEDCAPGDEKCKTIKERKLRVWNQMSQNHRASNRQAADHGPVKHRVLNAEGEAALPLFLALVRQIWKTAVGIPDEEKAREQEVELNTSFYRELKEKGIPNFAEIEHRRWVANNLIDGFAPLSAGDKVLWNTGAAKKELKEQKIHKDLIPFNNLDDLSQSKDISGVLGVKE